MTLIFLESLCDDPAVIAANVALKVSMGDPDYKDMSPEDAKRDFLRRIKEYEAVYETITEPHLSYFKIINIGDQVTVCRIHGYLQSRIAFYLMNLHLKPRSIFFSRVRCAPHRSRRSSSHTCLSSKHGESQFNVEGKIGGDSDLSERGFIYSTALPALIRDNIGDAPLTVTIQSFSLPASLVVTLLSGLDFHPQAHNPDCARAALPQINLEVAG